MLTYLHQQSRACSAESAVCASGLWWLSKVDDCWRETSHMGNDKLYASSRVPVHVQERWRSACQLVVDQHFSLQVGCSEKFCAKKQHSIVLNPDHFFSVVMLCCLFVSALFWFQFLWLNTLAHRSQANAEYMPYVRLRDYERFWSLIFSFETDVNVLHLYRSWFLPY